MNDVMLAVSILLKWFYFHMDTSNKILLKSKKDYSITPSIHLHSSDILHNC